MNMFVKEILFFLIFSPFFVDAIIGGKYANPHEYPWMVNVVSFAQTKRTPTTSCGGAIISENMILTAAHCVEHGWTGYQYKKKINWLDLYLGERAEAVVRIGHSSIIGTITVKVKSKLIHPNYTVYGNPNLTHDIALLELSENLKFNKEIQPIKLPDEEDFNETNYLDKSRSKFMVAGWGLSIDIPKDFYRLFKSSNWTVHKSKIPKERYLKFCEIQESGKAKESLKCEDNLNLMNPISLKVAEVDYIKLGNDSCNDKKEFWRKNPLLIRAMSTKPYVPGFCNGDSGGPLMKLDVTSGKYELVGIVSSFSFAVKSEMQGPNGCLGTLPGLYTRVSAFTPWIKESMTKTSNPYVFMELYQ